MALSGNRTLHNKRCRGAALRGQINILDKARRALRRPGTPCGAGAEKLFAQSDIGLAGAAEGTATSRKNKTIKTTPPAVRRKNGRQERQAIRGHEQWCLNAGRASGAL
jgi:hypothetical protein